MQNSIYKGITNNYDVRTNEHLCDESDASIFGKLSLDTDLRSELVMKIYDLNKIFKLDRGEITDIESIIIKVFQAIPQLVETNFNIASVEITKDHDKRAFVPIALYIFDLMLKVGPCAVSYRNGDELVIIDDDLNAVQNVLKTIKGRKSFTNEEINRQASFAKNRNARYSSTNTICAPFIIDENLTASNGAKYLKYTDCEEARIFFQQCDSIFTVKFWDGNPNGIEEYSSCRTGELSSYLQGRLESHVESLKNKRYTPTYTAAELPKGAITMNHRDFWQKSGHTEEAVWIPATDEFIIVSLTLLQLVAVLVDAKLKYYFKGNINGPLIIEDPIEIMEPYIKAIYFHFFCNEIKAPFVPGGHRLEIQTNNQIYRLEKTTCVCTFRTLMTPACTSRVHISVLNGILRSSLPTKKHEHHVINYPILNLDIDDAEV